MFMRFLIMMCVVGVVMVFTTVAYPLDLSRNDYQAGDGPQSVVAAYLDSNSYLDLVVADKDSNVVSILFDNGNGTFAEPITYPVRTAPYSVFAADLDNDGDIDLAVACVAKGADGPDSVSILLNNGDGSFAPMINYQTGSDPQCVFADDFDGDGDKDLAIANRYSRDVSILFNNGNGQFGSPVNYSISVGEPYYLFAANLDNDTDYDLAVSLGQAGSNTIAVLFNLGSGTFDSPVYYSVGSRPWGVFISDLDGDSDNDIAVANQNSNNVSILFNNGFGIFGTAVNYSVGSNPISIYGGDLEGEDNDIDLAIANAASDNVSVLFNNGNGMFATAVNYDVGSHPTSVYSANLNLKRDSTFDLVVANNYSNDVTVLLNGCCENRGNVDGITGAGGPVDVADMSYLTAYLFQGGPPPPYTEEGNVDGIGPVDVSDLSYLIAFLFQGGPPPPPCPASCS